MSDIGYCEKHNRQLEGFCKNCEELVCASCVLFANHQKHDTCTLKEGEEFVRAAIDESMRKGFLRKEYSESSIIGIKEYSLRLEKYKNEIVKKIDDGFKKIINLLKDRKDIISNEIDERFSEERDKIIFEENRWVEKQDISVKLKDLLKEKNATILLINSKYICEGIRTLNEKLEFKEMKVYNDLDENMNFEKEINKQNTEISLSFDEILANFGEYMSAENVNILEYKA